MRHKLSHAARCSFIPLRHKLYFLAISLFVLAASQLYLAGFQAGVDDCGGITCDELTIVIGDSRLPPKHTDAITLAGF